MDFSNYFILQVSTVSGVAHFVLSKEHLCFFREMQQEFDRARFEDYCQSLPDLSGSDVFEDEVFCVCVWCINNFVKFGV